MTRLKKTGKAGDQFKNGANFQLAEGRTSERTDIPGSDKKKGGRLIKTVRNSKDRKLFQSGRTVGSENFVKKPD